MEDLSGVWAAAPGMAEKGVGAVAAWETALSMLFAALNSNLHSSLSMAVVATIIIYFETNAINKL